MRFGGSIPFLVPVAGKISPADSDTPSVAARAKSWPVDVMDEATFREFYREAAPGLRAYVRRACGDAALADDLVQEAFYRFLRVNLPAGESWQTRAYLYRTASSLRPTIGDVSGASGAGAWSASSAGMSQPPNRAGRATP